SKRCLRSSAYLSTTYTSAHSCQSSALMACSVVACQPHILSVICATILAPAYPSSSMLVIQVGLRYRVFISLPMNRSRDSWRMVAGSVRLLTTTSGSVPSSVFIASVIPPRYWKKSSLSSTPYTLVDRLCTTALVPESVCRNSERARSLPVISLTVLSLPPQNPCP